MTETVSRVTIFFALTIFFILIAFIQPIHAFEQKGFAKLPGSSLSKSTAGLLRKICYDGLVFVAFGGRNGGAIIQMKKGGPSGAPLTCDDNGFTVRKQISIPSTMLDKSDSGIFRIFEIDDTKILLVTLRNGPASLLQLAE